ncbi:SDR family NAD(P)-dependent oxidoreductase [Dietzia sp. PP-33]|uniref:SDR family NAD(P)-dependent oxidoreductase n=1 Tax=Dietzia sp. PP-33 TaxID=2957500 RepID=UPI0029B647C5|nr:SDR family NAD(P)-dependent oxidoreductase [Dietzia sp. PP-33]MDX2358961.1 SDR family oxidoreductase [Dietzia sp. PP-33]
MSAATGQRRTALVTGAARGIGLATAQALAEAGFAVALCDVLIDDGNDAVEALREAGHEAVFVELDVRSTAAVATGIEQAANTLGGLDVAVNNAGVRAVAAIANLSDEDWDRVIDVNLTGVFRCMRAQIPLLLPHGGAIVNIASIWGLAGWPSRSAYVAAKHGVVGLTRSAAREYGTQGLRVNAVAPGPIATDAAVATVGNSSPEMDAVLGRTAMGRFGQPEEVAGAAVWLASAPYVTGEVVAVDGGWGA